MAYQVVTQAQKVKNDSKSVDVDYVHFVFLIWLYFLTLFELCRLQLMNDELEEM
jgi:glycopeptide antibiotics resistance protein